jgi:hypothetical protein
MSMLRAKGLSILCAAAFGTAALVFGGIVLPKAAHAKPEFAAQTGKPCGTCHVSQAGGGKLTNTGEKFKANGYKMK